ncbi:toprim domain-containing protein [Paenibacillus alvei]|uniref:Toprim domain-containing protein n=1 Tax=Paenibacillus alvei TaxID=44250 RepID=A0ABT4GV94_PAEAL|nr:toprim domain-containing protein [Paenibacillus alvei]MCY9760371.1 toprim domain-containing protein [Paenibacillus alvei]MCY9767663.1 toprim domain-containing protein [Paenibacillus alvei]
MINYEEELRKYEWVKPMWTSDKFTASSPFRTGDSTASFYVWLEDNPRFHARAGDWGDSGAVDPEYRRGDFVKLLAFLRQETEYEAREYLRYAYTTEWTSEEELTLSPPKLAIESAPKPLSIRLLDQYADRHPYLERRGISEAVLRALNVGYDRVRQAVTIPWFLPDGRLGNVMYRSVNSKIFWFAKVCPSCGHGHIVRHNVTYRCKACGQEAAQPIEGMPIRSMLYGMDVIYRRKVKRAALVEAPIDSLFLMSCGIPAVAVGGTAFNEAKRDLIIRSGIEEITLFTDNDKPGEEMKRKAIELLDGFVTLKEVVYPEGCKDPCDVGDPNIVREMFSSSTKYSKLLQLEMI